MESLSDIVAEMRRNGDAWCEDKSRNKTECLGLITLQYAERIEAAWKREKAEIEANAFDVGGIVEAARHTPGNAAAIREALELALDALISWLNGTMDRTTNGETIKAIRAALSAPARNCDLRYYNNATIDECSARAFVDHLRYCEKYGACGKCPIHSENGSCLAKYLLSPAEGGAK